MKYACFANFNKGKRDRMGFVRVNDDGTVDCKVSSSNNTKLSYKNMLWHVDSYENGIAWFIDNGYTMTRELSI